MSDDALPTPDDSATTGLSDEDLDLLRELRRVAGEADPVPDSVRQAAAAAITFRDPDGELAALVAVSSGAWGAPGLADGQASAALRAGGVSESGSLMLSFAASDVYIDLEVTVRGDRVDVIGQLVGTEGSGATIEDVNGPRDLAVDPLGRFVADGLRRGPIRLRCTSGLTGSSVTTAWTTV